MQVVVSSSQEHHFFMARGRAETEEMSDDGEGGRGRGEGEGREDVVDVRRKAVRALPQTEYAGTLSPAHSHTRRQQKVLHVWREMKG